METDRNVETNVREFIRRELLQGQDSRPLTDTTHLVEGGIVDSINVLRMVDFLEERYDVLVEPTDIREFTTISNIARIVRARLAG